MIEPKPKRIRPPEYHCWTAMVRRCTDPNFNGYETHGARGVRVCERWRTSFEAFVADMGPRPTLLHSIDRADGTGHYEPANCRWATVDEQQRNRRDNVWLVHDGERMVLADWARRLGMSPTGLRSRIHKRGLDRALSEPGPSAAPARRKAKLDEQKVREIRAARRAGVKGAELARRYGVDKSLISQVCRGQVWRHVDPDDPCLSTDTTATHEEK